MLTAQFASYKLHFKRPSGTSRGVLYDKESYFLRLEDPEAPFPIGWGEVGILRGLSADDVPELVPQLKWTCDHIHLGLEELWFQNSAFPSIQFALEQAFSHLQHGFAHFENALVEGTTAVPINGLVWMGDAAFMQSQIEQRLAEGFTTLKMKVGAISWTQELALLRSIREVFPAEKLQLRVDANGAFDFSAAMKVGYELARLDVHSIEQPIAPQFREDLARVTREFPVPVALDESLIGLFEEEEKARLLDEIFPPYIILKPSFVGGWKGSDTWVRLAEQRGIQWWSTSALESNLGLNAVAQWAASKPLHLAQGLGTGSLYTNNIPGPWEVAAGQFRLAGDLQRGWDLTALEALF